MIWFVKDKETIIKTCFAIFPKRIGGYRLWLHRYWKTWDYIYDGIFSGYVSHYFAFKEDAEKYVNGKMKTRLKRLNAETRIRTF